MASSLSGREGKQPHVALYSCCCAGYVSRLSWSQVDLNGVTNGVEAETGWLTVVPAGFRPLLKWVSQRYGRPIIVVTENGMDR